jgi:Holliday junction resolvase RusA-like endonuclease
MSKQFTSQWFAEYQRKRAEKLNAKQVPNNPAGVRATDAKPAKRHTLVSPLPGEVEGGVRPLRRAKVLFRVFSTRPADWDNYHVKELQDLLIKVGVLDGDEWDFLQGEIISEKVYTEAEERTEITITFDE